MRIAIDAMGGDLGPSAVVQGAVSAVKSGTTSAELLLVGDEAILSHQLERFHHPAQIRVVHAPDTILMTEKPIEAIRKKPGASVLVAVQLVKRKEAEGIVTIGNTGAAMAAAQLTLGTISGIDRSAIAITVPSRPDPVLLLDAGANVDCNPQNILEFAMMGDIYAKTVLHIERPRVALLSNGEEPSKGNRLTRSAYSLFDGAPLNFVGYLEGMDIFRSRADVVVCDGFSGNIVLKVGEGVADMVLHLIRDELSRHRWMWLPLFFLRKGIQNIRSKIDYREFGGAPLLGVKGVCIIGHGRSDALAIQNAIRIAHLAIEGQLVEQMGTLAAQFAAGAKL
ncbi:MAG: phosphate acyltransferase PlsX [Armatimonadetes bacterium]|nr:phosphate acyltransferase PlsX [Armatimonadota bacterium]